MKPLNGGRGESGLGEDVSEVDVVGFHGDVGDDLEGEGEAEGFGEGLGEEAVVVAAVAAEAGAGGVEG